MKTLRASACLASSLIFVFLAAYARSWSWHLLKGTKFDLEFVGLLLVLWWVPCWSWLLLFLPLALVRGTLGRWPWYGAAACGAAGGGLVLLLTKAIVSYEAEPFLYVLMVASVALQFAVGNLLIRGSRPRLEPDSSALPPD